MRHQIAELLQAVADIAEELDYAARLAYEMSGADDGQEGDEESGCPTIEPTPGWPAMLEACGRLGSCAELVRKAIPEELVEAAKGEAEALDEMEALADAASY